MARKFNWDRLRRERAGAAQDLQVIGDSDSPAEGSREEVEFVPRNQRRAARDKQGRLRASGDWRDEVRKLKGQAGHPDTIESDAGD